MRKLSTHLHPVFLLRSLPLWFLLAALPLADATAEPLPLANANFTEWQDGIPKAWSVTVGARSGGEKLSRLTPLAGGGIELAGKMHMAHF